MHMVQLFVIFLITLHSEVFYIQKMLLPQLIQHYLVVRLLLSIQSCMYQKVITFGNVKTFDAIRKKMLVIDEHLQAVEKSEELDLEILESLRMILEMFAGLEREDEVNE